MNRFLATMGLYDAQPHGYLVQVSSLQIIFLWSEIRWACIVGAVGMLSNAIESRLKARLEATLPAISIVLLCVIDEREARQWRAVAGDLLSE